MIESNCTCSCSCNCFRYLQLGTACSTWRKRSGQSRRIVCKRRQKQGLTDTRFTNNSVYGGVEFTDGCDRQQLLKKQDVLKSTCLSYIWLEKQCLVFILLLRPHLHSNLFKTEICIFWTPLWIINLLCVGCLGNLDIFAR